MSDQKIFVKRTLSNNWFLLKIAFEEAPFITSYEMLTHAQHRLIVFSSIFI